MATVTIPWTSGSGNITLNYTGQGDGTIVVTSSDNDLDVARSQTITIKTTAGGVVTRTATINQAAGPNFRLSDGKAFVPSGSDYFNVQSS